MFTAKGQEGYLIANDIELVNGTVTSSKDAKFPLISGGFQRVEPFGAEAVREAVEAARNTTSNRRQAYFTGTVCGHHKFPKTFTMGISKYRFTDPSAS